MAKNFINTKEDGLAIYLKDVRKYKTITAEKEAELGKRIQEGDESAIEELTRANLRFVLSIAKDYQGQGVPLPDLINEGNYGLIIAARKFDFTKGFRFISYAVHWVKQAIKYSLNEHSRTVRLPTNMVNKLNDIKKEREAFEKEHNRDAQYGEVEEVHVPSCCSLHDHINEEGDELIQMISDDTFASPEDVVDEATVVRQKLEEAMSKLSERERDILKCYFGLNGEEMTLESIGDEYQLTKERIRQIKEKAIRKTRHHLGDFFESVN
jgi:RNA polymerase primary sigma factor